MEGHPFYYEALSAYSELVTEIPLQVECILNTPIWFNKQLKTSLDPVLVEKGFVMIKDVFLNSSPMEEQKIRSMR